MENSGKSIWWIKTNYNPWKVNTIGDCAIRAVSAAIGMSYKEVCKTLGVSYVIGRGLRRNTGIDLNDIKKKFSDYFGAIEDFTEDLQFVPPEKKGSIENAEMMAFDNANGIDDLTSGLTLNDFCRLYINTGTYLVSLLGDPTSTDPYIKNGGHIVCAVLSQNRKKKGFIDTWDSGNMKVDCIMEVVKKIPIDSPLHWKYDYATKRFIV